ncbi:hypothetical protein P8605_26420 [Streptomyces sp. T-3]|nr:hypothetical protein [Streptomyces sp. T-3]
MKTPTPNEVETSEDFRVLLQRLIGHFESLGSEAPEIDDVLLRWAASLPGQAPDPGWPGLAGQLLDALAAPTAGFAEPAPLRDERLATTPGELRTFLRALAADYARDRAWATDRQARGLWAGDGGGWACASLAGYLESWHAWLDTWLDGQRRPADVPLIEPVTWESVAMQLGAAGTYE